MDKITPHLWFDKEATQAAEFYTSVFENSAITFRTTLHGTPTGDTDLVNFVLSGQPFAAISAGPLFRFNPSLSFLVACRTTEEVNAPWNRLSEGGRALMPLGSTCGWLYGAYPCRRSLPSGTSCCGSSPRPSGGKPVRPSRTQRGGPSARADSWLVLPERCGAARLVHFEGTVFERAGPLVPVDSDACRRRLGVHKPKGPGDGPVAQEALAA